MSSPWKACDLRGKFPSEVTPELLRAIGRSAATLLPAGSRVLVAGDFRDSTPELKSMLVEGLLTGPLEILDAGSVATPVAYFAHRTLATDAIFIVTASHNPPDWNGLKLMFGQVPPNEPLFHRLRAGLVDAPGAALGRVLAYDAVTPYRQWIEQRWRHLAGRLTAPVVIDAGNGAQSTLAPQVFDALGIPATRLFCTPDGRFPNRAPDSSSPRNLTALMARVIDSAAPFGLAWDGDGDRVALIAAGGRPVSADQLSILLAEKLLAASPGSPVVYDIKLSDAVRRAILNAGGDPLMERSGHAFIKRRMLEENAVFGCEASGHYFFRELHGGDDGLFTALEIIELATTGPSLADRLSALPEMHMTTDLRIPAAVLPFGEVSARLRDSLPVQSVETVDGVRLRLAEGIVLARPSVTEAATSIRIEGNTREALEGLIDSCTLALSPAAALIRGQIDL